MNFQNQSQMQALTRWVSVTPLRFISRLSISLNISIYLSEFMGRDLLRPLFFSLLRGSICSHKLHSQHWVLKSIHKFQISREAELLFGWGWQELGLSHRSASGSSERTFSFSFFPGLAGNLNYGLMNAKQVLYHWATASALRSSLDVHSYIPEEGHA